MLGTFKRWFSGLALASFTSLFFFSLAGCGGSGGGTNGTTVITPVVIPAGPMQYQEVSFPEGTPRWVGDASGRFKMLTYTNSTDWVAFWMQQTTDLTTPKPAAPSFDFSKQTVAALFMMSVNGCDYMEMVSVISEGTRIVVRYKETNLEDNNANLPEGQQIHCPAVVNINRSVISIPAANIPIVFVKV